MRSRIFGNAWGLFLLPKIKNTEVCLMREYINQTPFTHVYDKFEYFAEDFDCIDCANFIKNNRGGHGCGRSVCEFQDLKDEATRHGRIKRPKGWANQCLPE